MNSNMSVQVIGHVRIEDADTKEVLLDKKNAVHPQNMARILARALAKEPNYFIHRIAFGNGGTVTDPTGNIIFNPTNDGRNGSWESRLYNETYSEIVDASSVSFGSDPGSAEPGNIRTGGGAVPEDDPAGGGVYSEEVGTKSNVVISMFINKNEPSGQIASINDFGVEIDDREATFQFDELGLYSPGKQAAATSGHSSVNVGNKTSEDSTLLLPETEYTLHMTVDGDELTIYITTPAGGSGTAGALTYGDLCEGLNTGDWITSGDDITQHALAFITDRSGGTYPTILNKESYGYLTFQSFSSGSTSQVVLDCTGDADDLLRTLTNNLCVNANVNETVGQDAGVLNDSIDTDNERERLLTHIVFPPITKSADKAINIVYTLTISVARTSDSRGIQNLPDDEQVSFP